MAQSTLVFFSGLGILALLFWYFASDMERRKRNIGTILIFGILGLCAWSLVPQKIESGFAAEELTPLADGKGYECTVRILKKKDEDGKEIDWKDGQPDLEIALETLRQQLNIQEQGISYAPVLSGRIHITIPETAAADVAKVRELVDFKDGNDAELTEEFTFEKITQLTEAKAWQATVQAIPGKDADGKPLFFDEKSLKDRIKKLQGKLALKGDDINFEREPSDQIVVRMPNASKEDADKIKAQIGAIIEVSRLKPGIDLAGGSAFTVEVQAKKDDKGTEIPVDATAITQAIKTLESRLNPKGNKDLLIFPQPPNRIIIQMPGISPEEAAKTELIITKTATLELREVYPQSSKALFDKVLAGEDIVPGYEPLIHNRTDDDGEPLPPEYLFLSKRVPVKGKHVKSAFPDSARTGVIVVNLSSEGGKRMIKFTEKMEKGRDRIAVVLDDVVMSAPVVQATLGSSFVIEGVNSDEERRNISSALMNPLENPVIIEEERTVSAVLGEATIKQGINAGIAGLALTLVFILIYYRIAGLIALFGLTIAIVIIFGAMAMFEFTFTLPGIAGIILTIGVAVDANVLIYERLREELKEGKSVRAAIQAAYEKAFSAIFDANITTLITAIILFWRASGTVKGFAITLTIGILASMFAALLATRVLFWWGCDSGILKKLSFFNIIPEKSIDFMCKRKPAFVISSILLVGSLLFAGIKGERALGIDFVGGSIITYETGDTIVPTSEVESALKGNLSKDPTVQNEQPVGSGNILTVQVAEKDTDAAVAALNDFEALNGIAPSTDFVGAKLGREFLKNSIIALLLGLIGILIYITVRFEFSFAVGAFAALFHDIIIAIGIVILWGDEISLIHVGAFLTIAGYSINDTIVVFDRIRESLRMKRDSVENVMNFAINATLSRTLLTSLTTFMAVLVLFIFGGTALKAFSFAIMIGVVIGTYSSIFVASPIVLLWSKARGTNLRRELLDANLEAQVNPARG